MTRTIAFCLLSFGLLNAALAQNPRVWLDTNHGPIILELDQVNAPIATGNFLAYVNDGFYDGLVFHRSIRDFVIQGGGFNQSLEFRPPTRPAIQGEPGNGLLNVPGTIAMALSGNPANPNSGTSQFFINTGVNDFLDADFTVFGQVAFGMEVVQQINSIRSATTFTFLGNTNTADRRFDDIPVTPPAINRAVQIDGDGFPIMPQHMGSWFDADNSGVGFNVEIARDTFNETGARMVVYWYDFVQGEQLWMLGVAPYEYGDTEVTLDLVTWDGQSAVDFLNPPPGENFVSEGTLTVRFDDCATGHFSYQTPSFGAGEITVSRLTLPEQGSCEGL
jgi:peptidyl-prolyl cis-trans isomerase A (cyclophilin A)